jgi:hypothetical protein
VHCCPTQLCLDTIVSLDELQEGLANLKEILGGDEEGQRDTSATGMELIAQHDAEVTNEMTMTQNENED